MADHDFFRLTIGIDFYLDGALHAARRWPAVPRVGETVVFRDNKTAVVERVEWGHDSPHPELRVLEPAQVRVYCRSTR